MNTGEIMIRLQSDAELHTVFPLMAQLREHLKDSDDFVSRVRLGESSSGYMLFGLEVGGEIVSLCGIQPMTLHCLSSRHPSPLSCKESHFKKSHCLSIRDFITDHTQRSQGYGSRLLSEVEEWARENGYSEITLSSGIRRKTAHDFYTTKMEFSLTSHTFRKKLCGMTPNGYSS